MFAPLYLSNHCVNGCVYCPYHYQNRHIPRRKLTQEELRREVIAEAGRIYAARIKSVIAENKYPTYKSSGMAYVEFAIEERELFKLLFMRDRDAAERADDSTLEPIFTLIAESVGVDIDTARLIHLEIWAFVHGIATMIVTDYYVPDIELISSMMTDIYMGLKSRFGGAK